MSYLVLLFTCDRFLLNMFVDKYSLLMRVFFGRFLLLLKKSLSLYHNRFDRKT